MRQEQTENFFEEEKDEEAPRRVSSPLGQPRRKTMQEAKPVDDNGFMVVGHGYSKEGRQDSKNKSAR